MQYITAQEASEKWNVSLRQVQRLLADGRIPNAKKYGRSWMIPADAVKSGGVSDDLAADLERMITAVYLPGAWDERAKPIYDGGIGYLTGNLDMMVDCFNQLGDDRAAKLCASSLSIAAAIETGNYPLYLKIEGFLKDIIAADISEGVTAYAELCLSAAAIGSITPCLLPEWLINGNFSRLNPYTRMEAAYNRARYFHYLGNYEASLAVAQTALNFDTAGQGTGIHGIYLRLVCAMSCFPLGRTGELRIWLFEAMQLALPFGFFAPFAEVSVPLGGTVEKCLKEAYPQYLEVVSEHGKRTTPNWIIFHNRFTSDNLTHILSPRELQLATLAAKGVPYAQIARHYEISVGRLNNIMQEICQKLHITSKKELSKFVFTFAKD